MSEAQPDASTADAGRPDPREELLAAVSEIDREARKAAFLQAALDAMLVFVVLRLALQLTPVGDGSGALVSVPIPGGLAGALSGVGIILPDPVTVTGAGAATVLTAVSWFVADAFLRYDRLGVERFEADNPVVEEALRTARDTAEGDVDNPVAVELYREVLGRLEDTSSRAFVQRRQLVAVVVGLALVSAATVGVAGLGLSPIGTGGDADVGTVGGAGGGGGAGGESSGSGGGEDLLGEEGEVERGTDDRSLQLRGEGEGQAGGGGDYSGGSFDADPGRVEASRAEFSEEERPEDAELVRAYTERIRGGGTDE